MGGFMGEIYEFDFQPPTYEDYKEEVSDLYNDLLELYMEFFNVYNDLCVALDEMDLYEKSDLDSFVIAREKVKYLTEKMYVLNVNEREIYYDADELLPYLLEHISREFNLRGVLNLDEFSPMDTEIYPDYHSIKDNFYIIRMIRAVKFYINYNELYSYFELQNKNCSGDQVAAMIPYDYSDIECLQTITRLKEKFHEPFDVHLCNKYKCFFSFTNPRVENVLMSINFSTFGFDLDDEASQMLKDNQMRTITSKTIRALIAIEHNKVINHRKGGALICNEPKENNVKKLNEYLKNKDELFLLYAFLLQSYGYLSDETVQDLDHLLAEMCKFTDKEYKDIKLSEKVVNYFFRRDAYSTPDVVQRKRKGEE